MSFPPARSVSRIAAEAIGRRPPSHARLRLRARIAREFALLDETLDLADRRLPFTRVADPDAVLDAAAASEATLRAGDRPTRVLGVPYWAGVWASARAIGEHALRRSDELRDRTVLDLGCGTGLAGLCALVAGARVALVDHEPAALLFARLNTLDFAASRVRKVDWRTDDLGERFDEILGSDILYEPEQWPFIERFCRRHLAEGGTLTLGEPGRPKSEPFADWIAARGWSVARSSVPTPERTVHLLRLAR